MNQLATLTGILLLATLTEALVEYLAKPWLRLAGRDAQREIAGHAATSDETDPVIDLATCYTAAVIGILLCLAYRADLLQLAGLYCPWPWVGPVITGILAGRGANFVHDFASRWLRG
ncbi:MAG: hypothetical protein GX597_00255 [Anaerolineaceae bacterium]|nr:hypothetical protein [Anaerolineaceae bacterium]